MPETKKEVKTVQIEKKVFLQFGGKEAAIDDIEAKIKEDYELVKNDIDPPEEINIYLKPEDGKAYYVINQDYAGDVDLFED